MLSDSGEPAKNFPLGRAIIVVLLLAGAGLIYYVSGIKTAPRGDILGEETNTKQKILPDRTVEKAKNDVSVAVGDLLRGSGDKLRDTATQSVEKVRETIVVTTLQTVTQQLEKLAPQDQEKVKEYICK